MRGERGKVGGGRERRGMRRGEEGGRYKGREEWEIRERCEEGGKGKEEGKTDRHRTKKQQESDR